MGGSKGCHDDCAGTIIFIFNSVALILSIAGLAGVGYIWYTQANPDGGATSLSVFIPDVILGLGVVVCLLVLTISLLGIITTALELRASKAAEKKKEPDANKEVKEVKTDKDGKPIKEKKPKGCCHNCGLLVYIGMCLFAFIFMLAVAAVAGVYSGKLDNFKYVDKVTEGIDIAKTTGDAWIDVLEVQLSNAVLEMDKTYPQTWNASQTALGCCGWSAVKATTAALTTVAPTDATAAPTTAAQDVLNRRLEGEDTTASTGTAVAAYSHADVVAFTGSSCCKDKLVVTDDTSTGEISYEEGCYVDGNKNVYTCEGMVAELIKGNLVKLCACAVVLAIVQLALGIAGCVVRFPKLFGYCDKCLFSCCRKKTNSKVSSAPMKKGSTSETAVEVL